MKNVKKQTNLFASYYLVIFSAMGGMLPFVNNYLQVNQGFTGAQLGIFTFCTLIVSVFIVPIWGILGDRSGKYKLLLLFSLGTSIIAGFIYSIQTGYLAVIISGIILEICRSGVVPLADVQAVTFSTKHNGNYGFIRSMGSLGYVLGSILVGQVVSENDFSPMLTVYLILLLLAFAIAFMFPKAEKETNDEKVSDPQAPKPGLMSVIKNRHFLFICIISLMTGILMDSANGYAGIHMMNTLKGPANSAGMFTVATALPEILLLGVIGKWFNKYGYQKIFLLNAVVLVVRYILYVISPNIYIFLVASLVHCIATGVATVGNLAYLKEVVADNSYGTAVTLYNASISVGRAVYSLIFGYMLDGLGSTAIFIFATVIMIIAAFWIYKTHTFDSIDQSLTENKA